jgi:hypothetical protein
MDRKENLPDERRQRTIEAVATFSALMHAHERGELTKADEARCTLARFGIAVRIRDGVPHVRQANGGTRHA